MAVSHEIKSQLAKLLATEDLIVESKKVKTAQFNVQSRVLTLPQWDKASEVVYDSLVAHEVGHALYTPNEDWCERVQVPQQFVNVTEDVRIEKLMKRRYGGLSKTFYRGYNELADQDFFEIADTNVNDMNLADRVNIYFKIGNFVDVVFTADEQKIVDQIYDAESFDDALNAAVALYKFCKDQADQQKNEDIELSGNTESQSETQSEPMSPGGNGVDNFDQEKTYPQETVLEDFDEDEDEDEYEGDVGESSIEVETASSLEESLENLNSEGTWENVYVEAPPLNMEKVIIPNKVIHDNCEQTWVDNKTKAEEDGLNFDIFADPDTTFKSFKKESQKEVNYLVKEFECKKAAESYARATTARTGILDCTKLHTYKYNENLFKKVTTLSDGKNHGLVFVLDWSGSMQYVLQDTVKQLYSLLWFCKKCNIPFDVYAFTNDHHKDMLYKAYDEKDGLVHVAECFSMMHFFTSTVSASQLEKQMINIWRTTYCIMRWGHVPMGMCLSGTPLNEAVISLHHILPEFKKRNNLQKVQCVILTDGEAYPLKYHKEVHRHWENESFLGTKYIQGSCYLRNRRTGRTYDFDKCDHWTDMTDVFLQDLSDTLPDINLIGIRILQSKDASPFVRRYLGRTDEYETVMKKWRKTKTMNIKKSSYSSYFGLSSSIINDDASFSVDEGATKAKIKTAFMKSLKTKKMNKKILSEFIELVA